MNENENIYSDPTPDSYTDERVDAVFAGIDKTLARVSEALQEANLNIDLSAARASVRNAGQNVSRSVHKVKRTPVPAGQSVGSVVLTLVKRFLAGLFGTKRPAPPPVSDEELPFVEETQHSPEQDLPIPHCNDETVEAVLQFQQTQLCFVEDCATQLYRRHPKTAMQLEEICRVYRCILYALARRPAVLPKLQRFFGYYVPILKKFCAAYLDFSRQTQAASNPTAEKTMLDIEEAFVSLEEAFRKKVDELYGAVELDISSDISVLDAMLRKDGLL